MLQPMPKLITDYTTSTSFQGRCKLLIVPKRQPSWSAARRRGVGRVLDMRSPAACAACRARACVGAAGAGAPPAASRASGAGEPRSLRSRRTTANHASSSPHRTLEGNRKGVNTLILGNTTSKLQDHRDPRFLIPAPYTGGKQEGC